MALTFLINSSYTVIINIHYLLHHFVKFEGTAFNLSTSTLFLNCLNCLVHFLIYQYLIHQPLILS